MKIAFCFLTYSDIIRNDIWDKFFENADINKYTVFIHPKKIFKSKYNIVKKLIYTQSKNHISIVRATLQLLRETFDYDINITHFIFITQSCIPLYNFDIIYKLVNIFDRSVISAKHNTHNDRYLNMGIGMKQKISYYNFLKQHANMILIRNDV